MSASYDPILAEVMRCRLEAVCDEAAITLNHTSGSPILTEAHDFATALISADGEVIAFSGYLPPHFVSALHAMRDVTRSLDLETIAPGDHFAANDPSTAQPLHAGDPSVITPIFAEGELVAWAYCSVHVLDIGGLSAGGWVPGAFDRYGEGFMFPLTKIVSGGRWNETFVDLFLANVRMEEALNDLRSCVAANNTAAARLDEVFDRYRADLVREYAETNIELSERRARGRIAALPDGVYSAVDWVEYDGHGVETLAPLSVRLVVRGEELLIDLSDSPPQANCFVNTTRSGLLGMLLGVIIRSLFPDLPMNAGLIRPLRVVRSAPGTMLNPGKEAATSGGHMEAGTKVLKCVHRALHKAIGLSAEPEVRRRAAGLGGNVGAHNVIVGMHEDGHPAVWVSFDSLGTGLGAQPNADGRDCGCYEDMTGSRMLDVELEEESSNLYFYRRLLPDSGGHGYRRGGLGIDSAWQLQGMLSAQLTSFSNNTRVPAAAPGGGYPGGCTANLMFGPEAGAGSPIEVGQRLRDPAAEERARLLPSHPTNLGFDPEKLVRAHGSGGSGIGDPLFREPWRVRQDLENEIVGADVAADVYGVVLDSDGEVDEGATRRRRAELRAERLGREPSREPAPMEEYRPPLRIEADRLCCAHCDQDLAGLEQNWKEHAELRTAPLAERAGELGARVRANQVVSLVMCEFACPGCGSLLEVDIAQEGAERPHDIRVGASGGEQGEPF